MEHQDPNAAAGIDVARKMAESETVELPDLSSSQLEALRKRFLAEAAEEASAISTASGDVGDAEDHVYTNVSHQRIVLQDLGITAGKDFNPESFAPGETKDLLRCGYRLREIRASKHLVIWRDQRKLLVRGAHVVDFSPTDGFTRLAQQNPEGSFRDPLSGQRPYDLRLKEVEEREKRNNGDVV